MSETRLHNIKHERFKKGTVIDLQIGYMDRDGFGVAVVDGKRVFVTGALAGEDVRAKITHAGKTGVHATVLKVLRRSRTRVASPQCNQSPLCDACPLVVMSYHSQLAWKKRLIEQEVRAYASLGGVEIADVIPSPQPFHYRHSAKLVVGGKFSDPQIGIYKRNSHDIIDISTCPTHHPLINLIAEKVKTGIRKGKVPVFNARTRSGILRYLLIRVSSSTGQAMVIFVTAHRSFNEIHHLAKYLQAEVPEVKVVVQNVNPSSGNVLLGQEEFYVTKARVISETLDNTRFTISSRSFFQVNPGAATLLYQKVREVSVRTGREAVVDLYCGVGGISLFLAPHVKDVHGIEVVQAAVSDAEANSRLNGLDNCTFTAGDVSRILQEMVDDGEPVDLVVINPPRKGCDEEVLAAVAKLSPERMVYVSCSPQTLARDLDILSRAGYRTRSIQPVDMFPQTPHVENIAVLERAVQ